MLKTDFELAIQNNDREEIAKVFRYLAETIVKIGKLKIEPLSQEEAIVEGVSICFERLPRYNQTYNQEKKTAFNYFATILLGHYRQLYRKARILKPTVEL